jgi:hypothetical protein
MQPSGPKVVGKDKTFEVRATETFELNSLNYTGRSGRSRRKVLKIGAGIGSAFPL